VSTRIESPRFQRRLLWVAGLVLAAGIAAVLIVFLRNTGTSVATPHNDKPVQIVHPNRDVKLAPAARTVAQRFIQTAVLRKHLDQAWTISGPQVRGGLTYKEWLTGNIPVVPFNFPLESALISKKVVLDPDTGRVTITVVLLSTNKKVKPNYFFLDLVKVGTAKQAHWIVDGWVPAYGRPAIPVNPSN
jgi:hypothetical protein